MKSERTVDQQELDWVRKAQQGDRQAFGALVHSHRQGVVNVVYRMCGDVHLAEDAAQMAFLKAWQHLSRFRPGSSFRNWVYRIAANSALDDLRRERETLDPQEIDLPAPGLAPEERVEHGQRAERVRQTVLSLPEASRVVLVLREYEGLSYQEIAETLDIPMGTVMSRLSYARKRLLEMLSEEIKLAQEGS